VRPALLIDSISVPRAKWAIGELQNSSAAYTPPVSGGSAADQELARVNAILEVLCNASRQVNADHMRLVEVQLVKNGGQLVPQISCRVMGHLLLQHANFHFNTITVINWRW
jgi:hypothetical protein